MKTFFRRLVFCVSILCLLAGVAIVSPAQTEKLRAVTIVSEPASTVWIDDVRFGKTSKDGKLLIASISPGRHTVRVRCDGYGEISKALPATHSGEFKVPLAKTTDKAELAFQEAERLSLIDRDKAAEAYRNAIKLRPGYTDAYISLARLLSDGGDYDGALKAIGDLRRTKRTNAEASAVEGRIHREAGEEAQAITAFKRAIAEGKGFQPEAYTGLGLLYKDKAEGAGGEGNFAEETANYNEAAKNLKIAIEQLSGAPDSVVLYQLLGLVYERQNKFDEAIAIYQEFLRLFPNSIEAPTIQSFIDQVKKQQRIQ
ncbi:MAG TPA: tetratricopeptide repeat protein [Pyrinomonadaceae bacterium]|nr:tetratricopeptide repeat protein [Pyrinomonadaceae bacterium]